MSWEHPKNYATRPVAILGAGVLGRRIACTWASAGYNVTVRDPSSEKRSECLQYVNDNMELFSQRTSSPVSGTVQVFQDLEPAIENAWLVIEAIPEKLQLKISTFSTLEASAPQDCILCTNSSSYKSSEMISEIADLTKRRVLNMHYYMPPKSMVVELMTDGFTEEAIFPFMVARLKETAALPYVARKESTGFIFNRLWAAVKRETLTILSEGVSVPEEIDSLWTEIFIKGKTMPCKAMDEVGLDTVALIESHYIAERGLSSATLDYLQANYIDHGKLGNKSNAGGLYPPREHGNGMEATGPTLLVLDLGLSGAEPGIAVGQVLQLDADGKKLKTLVSNQSLPDGIDADHSTGRIFWTCMGVPGAQDGAVYSANRDGTSICTVVSPGTINTPKQLCLDTQHEKVYFSDREGCAVYRCNYDGSELETLIKNQTPTHDGKQTDDMAWCVGIAVSPSRGKFYWTQKGPSKGGKGRIFCADIEGPTGPRAEIRCILDGLPEPIDLEVDEADDKLYWTDRGEIPAGNTLNYVSLDAAGLPASEDPAFSIKPRIISRNFNEAIGLKLDSKNNHIYVTDLGGRIYCYDINKVERRVVYQDDSRAFSGIALI